MFGLKLLLVPAFLLAISYAGQRWGAAVAGWLAGLPVVAGPILFILALEQGRPFAAQAAGASLAAVVASVAFSLSYAHIAVHRSWRVALAGGCVAWAAVASLLGVAALPVWGAALLALTTLWRAAHAFPVLRAHGRGVLRRSDLLHRALAGAVLTCGVALLAPQVGGYWSGLFAVFPILGVVLAVSSHRAQGADFAIALLRHMVTGLYAFCAFCLSLSWLLVHLELAAAFGLAAAAALLTQWATRRGVARHLPVAAGPSGR